MSKRTLRDLLTTVGHAAFFAKDKAAIEQIITEHATKDADPEHDEPDGDEGKQAIVIHNHHNESGDQAATADGALGDRMKKIEDTVAALDQKFTKAAAFFDRIAKVKDDDLPPWLKKKDDDDGDDDGDNGDNGDEEKEETEDAGPDAPDGETGALSMEKLGEAEPELMNADPSKKTGEMRMGDAAAIKALGTLVKDIRARAEVLSPGIKLNLDSKPNTGTIKALCDARRRALTKALATDTGKKAVGSFTAKDIKGMSCDMTRKVFRDASDRMAAHNNSGSYVTGDEPFTPITKQTEVLKAMNARNKDFWSKQMGNPRLN